MSLSDREINGNVPQTMLTESDSMEESSEYTDADESISAPTEILAEFLSAVMTKDYANALKYCQLILSYEPSNSTAKEFYPLIVDKLKIIEEEGMDDFSTDSESENSSSSDGSNDRPNRKRRSDSDRTTASFSSFDDDDDADVNLNNDLCISETDIRNGNANVHYITTDKSGGEAKDFDQPAYETHSTHASRDPAAEEEAFAKLEEIKARLMSGKGKRSTTISGSFSAEMKGKPPKAGKKHSETFSLSGRVDHKRPNFGPNAAVKPMRKSPRKEGRQTPSSSIG